MKKIGWSVLKNKKQEIIAYRQKGVSFMSVYKILKDELEKDITYNGFYIYCKRNDL